jgi:threonyl-tRNA synthetase
VRLLSITDRAADYCSAFAEALCAVGVRAKVDDRQEKIGYKIREARMERIPYMLVAGDREVENGTFAVRKRGVGEIGSMGDDELLSLLQKDVEEKNIF